jgi:hypothetical protein
MGGQHEGVGAIGITMLPREQSFQGEGSFWILEDLGRSKIPTGLSEHMGNRHQVIKVLLSLLHGASTLQDPALTLGCYGTGVPIVSVHEGSCDMC